jgi:hypothetical protein
MSNEIEITDEIKKELSELIKNSEIKTPEKAKGVAGALLRRGVQPSWRLIREILGVGSATTLQNAVNQYWNELGRYLDKLEKRPELPESLVLEFNNVWDNALQLSEKQIKNNLQHAFEKAEKIERDVSIRNKELEDKLTQENTGKRALETQLQQLKQRYETQQEEYEQAKHALKSAQMKTKKNQEEFKISLKEQEKSYTKQYTKHQKSHQLAEQSLQKITQQLTFEKSQQNVLIQQHQHILVELKQDKQNELDRQAKQYESMLEHYSNEIGYLKVKQERFEKNKNKENQQRQTQYETNLVMITELQSKLTVLSQQNRALEKQNTHKASLLEQQQQELRQQHKESATLEARLEIFAREK